MTLPASIVDGFDQAARCYSKDAQPWHKLVRKVCLLPGYMDLVLHQRAQEAGTASDRHTAVALVKATRLAFAASIAGHCRSTSVSTGGPTGTFAPRGRLGSGSRDGRDDAASCDSPAAARLTPQQSPMATSGISTRRFRGEVAWVPMTRVEECSRGSDNDDDNDAAERSAEPPTEETPIGGGRGRFSTLQSISDDPPNSLSLPPSPKASSCSGGASEHSAPTLTPGAASDGRQARSLSIWSPASAATAPAHADTVDATCLSEADIEAALPLLGDLSGPFSAWRDSAGGARRAAQAILQHHATRCAAARGGCAAEAVPLPASPNASTVRRLLDESLATVLKALRAGCSRVRSSINGTCSKLSTAGIWYRALRIQVRIDRGKAISAQPLELLRQSSPALSARWVDRESGRVAKLSTAVARAGSRAASRRLGEQVQFAGFVTMWDFLRVWTPAAHNGGQVDKFLVLVTPPDPVVHAVCHRNDRGAGTGMLGGLSPAAILRRHPQAGETAPSGVGAVRASADRAARDAGRAWDGLVEASGPSPRHWYRTAAPGARPTQEQLRRVYMDDIRPLVEALVDRHPDLSHLRDEPQARSRYVTGVLVCLFTAGAGATSTSVSRASLASTSFVGAFFHAARMDLAELLPFSPGFIAGVSRVFEETATRADADLLSSAMLQRKDSIAVCSSAIERIGAGRCRPLSSGVSGVWNFEDFAWLWSAADDEMGPRSLQYWFRALDRDDDGVLDRLDLECALDDRAEEAGEDALATTHALTRLIDVVRPQSPRLVTSMDIRRGGSGPLVFDLLLRQRVAARLGSPVAAHAQY